jgi:invasion protein IalB
VRAPLGIALVRGLEVTFGTQPLQRAPFNICLSNGCQAVLILSKPLQEEILKAERALITTYAPNGTPYQAAASLKGLGTAIDMLNKRRGPS